MAGDTRSKFGTNDSEQFDYATVLGALCAFGLMFLAILHGGNIPAFINISSLLIVIGGTIGATLITFPLEEFMRAGDVMRHALYVRRPDVEQRLYRLTDLARLARLHGTLSLEPHVFSEPDPFFRKALQMLVDGIPADEIRRSLEVEIISLDERHRRGAQLFQTMGTAAPAMGLIGTLIGLVQMMQNLTDAASIGAGMATALLGTFYGAVLAYVIFMPLAGKLRARSREETRCRELTLEGILAMVRQSNPVIMEQQLEGFLPPEARTL